MWEETKVVKPLTLGEILWYDKELERGWEVPKLEGFISGNDGVGEVEMARGAKVVVAC